LALAVLLALIENCPPKADGSERQLGVTALEDKIVQAAVLQVFNAIYEPNFLGFSYGFRPGRGQPSIVTIVCPSSGPICQV
jgi:hypothetical protein